MSKPNEEFPCPSCNKGTLRRKKEIDRESIRICKPCGLVYVQGDADKQPFRADDPDLQKKLEQAIYYLKQNRRLLADDDGDEAWLYFG
jgi:ribosomal protein L37AE/L43A